MRHFTMRFLLAAIVFACFPAAASAQRDPMDPDWHGYRDVHHRNQCRLANQVLTRGQPANQRVWALRLITTCGPLGGITIGQLLRDHRAEAEWGEELEQAVNLTADLVDRSIYEAAFEIAADPGAGTAARVQAIRVLYYQISPGSRDPYESFLPGTRTFYVPGFHEPAVGDPLPDGALGELAVLASELVDDPAASEQIQSAATKLMIAAEVDASCADASTLEDCAVRVLKGNGTP